MKPSTEERDAYPAVTPATEEAAGRDQRGGDGWTSSADLAWEVLRRIHLGTRKPANWVQLFKFGVVGASGYAINLAVFALVVEALGVHHLPGAVAAFLVAVTNNFLWNRHWTFEATAGHPGFQAMRFLTVSVLALAVNLLVLTALVDGIGVRELPSQALAVAVAMPLNFIGNKLWTFAR